jgi:hypothetical protein
VSPSPPVQASRIARNLSIQAELLRVCRTLSERGIDSIVLKGVPLAHRVWGGLGRRERAMLDNDVLVRVADVGKAASVLEALGYRPFQNRPLPSRFDVEFELAFVTRTNSGALFVDLHWAPFPPLLYPVSEELVWRRTEFFELDGLELRVLDPAMTLVELASHFAQHTFSAAWVLKDLAAAWNTWSERIDREDLQRLAEETGLVHALDFALGAAEDLALLQAPPPPRVSQRAQRLRALLPAERLADARPRHDYVRAMLALSLAPLPQIPRWLRYQVFPPIEQMAAIYESPVSTALYLRYATRPWRPLGRLLARRRP